MTWREIFRDVLRGFTEADVVSLTAKLERSPIKPGGMTYLTAPESAALGEYFRRKKLIFVISEQ